MAKLIVVIMGQSCEKFLPMCLDSVKEAEQILYVDGGSKDDSWAIATNMENCKPIYNKWDESDKQMNGKQRNFYLNYLKKHYPNDWALCLDADEVVEDLSKLQEFIKTVPSGLYSVKMRHFVGDLGHEDATRQTHFVPNRLFKISEAKEYPLHSHPVLMGEPEGSTDCTTIWHLGHLPVEYMDYILKRYKQHTNDSIIHNQPFLNNWRDAHLFGKYPVREVNPLELPKQIIERYEINKDEHYFKGRGLELKHFIDAIHWKEFFKPKIAVELGCGLGPRLYALQNIGVESYGIEISQYAVDHSMAKNVHQGDVRNGMAFPETPDLVIAYDLLEHIDYENIDNVIDMIVRLSNKYILCSIPFLGDPNLEADPSHKIKETKEWWKKKFTDKGCKVLNTPQHFLYRNQLIILEVPK